MKGKITTYEIIPEKYDDALRIIEEFTRMVKYSEPGTRIYVSFQSSKNRNLFKHIMVFESEGSEELHKNSSHTIAFTEALYPLCKSKPSFEDFIPIGDI